MNIDCLFVIVNLMFGYSLIPEVIKSFKRKEVCINFQTLILTSSGMCLSLVCYIGLGLWLTLVSSLVSTACWIVLLIFKIKWNKTLTTVSA